MIFQLFELKGYTRLGLNSIKLIRLEMSEIVQVILGRNGSGKSSLLAELNPFPADTKFFHSDGHKLIVIKHGVDTYTLKSTFKPSPKHSFIKNDGPDLNPGGTATVQKDLCKQHLGVTPDIVSVITGAEKFTTMPAQRRRELLTMMCDTDYDYAIKVYNRVKESLRDTTGALKLAKKRLVAEMATLFTEEEYAKAQETMNALTLKSQELYQLKNTSVPQQAQAVQRVQAVEARIKEVARKFFDIRKSLLHNDSWTPSEIQEDIDRIKAEIASAAALVQANGERFDVISKRVSESGAIDDDEYKMLVQECADEVTAAQTLLERIKTVSDVINPQESTQACERIKEELMEALMALPNNESGWYSQDKFEKLTNSVDATKEAIRQTAENIFKVGLAVERMEQAKSHDTVNCPNCDHQFLPGYDKARHEELVSIRDKFIANKNTLEDKLKDDMDTWQEMHQYRLSLDRLKTLIASSGAIKYFWDQHATAQVISTAPMMLFSKFEQFHEDTKRALKAAEHNKKAEYIRARINNANNARQRDIQSDKLELARLEEQILNGINRQRKLNESLLGAIQYQKHVKMMLEVEQVMRNLKDDHEKAIQQGASAIMNDLIDQALVTTHADIATISAKLSDMRGKLGVINDIKAQIASLEDDEKAYKLIATTLSPTDGLIAEGLLGFIRSYVRAVNKIIKKFWTYRMEIRDCSTDGDSADLNYKFALDVEGDKLTRSDVKDGSSGMREAIDLAFRFVAMHYTGLSDYPLFLDEFGAFFDAEHKSRAPYAIKSVIDQMQFSQVFIISHHEMEYSAFPNAQFCVLDKNNILLSSEIKYNEHVLIES